MLSQERRRDELLSRVLYFNFSIFPAFFAAVSAIPDFLVSYFTSPPSLTAAFNLALLASTSLTYDFQAVRMSSCRSRNIPKNVVGASLSDFLGAGFSVRPRNARVGAQLKTNCWPRRMKLLMVQYTNTDYD